MSRGGPKPKPTKLKLLHGEKNKDRINLKEPKPAPVVPKCPAWLNKDAKVEWKRISKELSILGLLTRMDMAALAAYCDCYSRFKNASKQLQKHGMIIKAPSGYPVQSPYLSILNKALTDMKSYLIEFGMTPSSRTRISVEGNDKDDDFGKLLD